MIADFQNWKMKKYQQLILVTLSVFSFVSLLIYRHEYNKLRYVLEVFNFFGTPGLSPNSNVAQNVTVDKYLMSEPLPAWQRVSDTLYLYSAYWEVVGRRGRVKAPAIGILNENLNYGCYLRYELQADPVKGQFSFSELSRKSSDGVSKRAAKAKGYMFYCEGDEDQSVPIGVTFYKKSQNETSQAFLPVYKIKTDSPVQNSTAICILPNEYSYLKKLNYLEFLSFHRSIGIKDFIVYGANFQYNIISKILRNASYDTNLMVLQWNYPFHSDSELMINIAVNDCILRASGLYEYVIVLRWNQFFVPNSHSSAQSIISNLDVEKKISTFQVSTSIFCLEFNDDPDSDISLPIIFRKTRYAMLKWDDSVFVYNTNVKKGFNKKIHRDSVSIHWYAKCNGFDLKLKKKIDRSILAFQSEVMQSKFMRI